MFRIGVCILSLLCIAACAKHPDIDVTRGKPGVQTKSRSEPVFYNGKTYKLDFSYAAGSNTFDMKVSGMTAKQQKDAVAVATSSLGYFACPDGQGGRLAGQPAYKAGVWLITARCA